MESMMNEDIADEIMFLSEENVPSYIISETLGLNVELVDEFKAHHKGEMSLGRVYPTKT